MNKLKNLLGLSYRAKKLVIGIDNIEVVKDKVKLLVATESLSKDSLKKINHIGELEIPTIIAPTLTFISEALGLKNVKVVGVLDEGFKELMTNSLK